MHKIVITLLAITCTMAFAQKTVRTITLKQLPKNAEQFKQLRNQTATTAEGGAAMFVLALKLHLKDKKVGQAALVMSVNRKLLDKSLTGYKGYDLRKAHTSLLNCQLKNAPYLPDSYIVGSSPENGYAVKLPFKIRVMRQATSGYGSEDTVKVFVASSGADSPRPITLKQNNRGYWKAHEWSSLLVGVRKPVVEEDDDL